MRAAVITLLVCTPALAQDIPEVNVDRLCGSRDMCHGSTSPACLALPEGSKAFRRRLFNECVDEQQRAHDIGKEGLTQLNIADRTECLRRLANGPDYRILGNCVTELVMRRERERYLEDPRTLRR